MARRDTNTLAFDIMQQATGEKSPIEGKNAKAVTSGRMGGNKGGKARAAKLSPEERSKIAKAAARARWSK